MKKQIKSNLVSAALVVLVTGYLFLPGLISAGDLEPPGSPEPTMHTLNEIYGLVENINSMVDPAPCGPCDPTGAGVAKTGQTGCWDAVGSPTSCTGTGQDGEFQQGVSWPVPRFTDNADGTVTDNLTGLIWLKNADCFGQKKWNVALSDSNGLADASCGLTDGSIAGDWRLANVKELLSLIDYSQTDPAMPSGHPFTGVQSDSYWSSTSIAANPDGAFFVHISLGYLGVGNKDAAVYLWPVRGGN
jgi:hypothetical protein